MTRFGPRATLSLSCLPCEYERWADGGHRCFAPTVLEASGGEPRALVAPLDTPTWCPLRDAAIAQLVQENRR